MNITVKKVAPVFTPDTGGEYAIATLDIEIDTKLSRRKKTELIIHAVIENYFPSIEHSKIDEVVGLIQEALDQLETLRRTDSL